MCRPAQRLVNDRTHRRDLFSAKERREWEGRRHLTQRIDRFPPHIGVSGAQQRLHVALQRRSLEPPDGSHRETLRTHRRALQCGDQFGGVLSTRVFKFQDASLGRFLRQQRHEEQPHESIEYWE